MCCRSESGVLSSFYSYFVTETPQHRGPTAEEQEAIRKSQRCLQECHVERLITESKFLVEESLQELAKVSSSVKWLLDGLSHFLVWICRPWLLPQILSFMIILVVALGAMRMPMCSSLSFSSEWFCRTGVASSLWTLNPASGIDISNALAF